MHYTAHATAIIDEGAQIGAGAVVTRDVKPYTLLIEI